MSAFTLRVGKYWTAADILFGIKQALEPGLCIAEGCSNPRVGRQSRSSYCYKHRQRIAVHLDPVGEQFYRLKKSAKSRGIAFTLTKEEWRKWCEDTGYMKGREGPRAEVLTVDRIDSNGPYSLANIQVLSHSENARKENARRKRVVIGGRFISQQSYKAPQYADPLDCL